MSAILYLLACWRLLFLFLAPVDAITRQPVVIKSAPAAAALPGYWDWHKYVPEGPSENKFFFTKLAYGETRIIFARVENVSLPEAPSRGKYLNLPVYTIQTSTGTEKHIIPGWFDAMPYGRTLLDLVNDDFCYLVAKSDLPGFEGEWFNTHGPPGFDDKRGAIYCKAPGQGGERVTHPKAMVPDMVCGWRVRLDPTFESAKNANTGYIYFRCSLNWPTWCSERDRPWMTAVPNNITVNSECAPYVCKDKAFNCLNH